MKFINEHRTLPLEAMRLNDGISVDILENFPLFNDLIEAYYEYLNQEGYPIYEIENILNNRDIDYSDDSHLDLILDEVAHNLPRNITSDKRVLYKHIQDMYKAKGTINSFRVFFKAFFDSDVDVTYPKDELFILDGGLWDEQVRVPQYSVTNRLPMIVGDTMSGDQYLGETYGAYLNNVGFLDDLSYLRDDYFYHEYSYVINSATNFDEWKYLFNKIVHPSGFNFFGNVNMIITLSDDENNFRWPIDVPGLTEPQELETFLEIDTDFCATRYDDIPDVYIEVFKDFEPVDNRDAMFNLSHDMYFLTDDISTFFDREIDSMFKITDEEPSWDKTNGVEIEQVMSVALQYILTG